MINSVRKALSILGLFSELETHLSLAEISERLELPKSTAHNLINTLVQEGYLEKFDGGVYALGTAPLLLSHKVRVNVEIRDPASPLLRELADYCRASIYLAVPNHNVVLYIYAIESHTRLQARTAVGDVAPYYCTSVGKAMLAHMSQEKADELFNQAEKVAFTSNTITSLDGMHEDLKLTRERGYAIDNAEHEEGIYCIGAPIMNRRGQVIAACSISSTNPHTLDERLPDLSARVTYAAQEISRRMGFVPKIPGLITLQNSFSS